MAREPISAYQYYMSINDTAKAANYDSAAADGSEENPYAIRDWYDIYNVYNSSILGSDKYGSFILVNDIDFNKVSTRRLNALQNIETIPELKVNGFFDFNGHSFKNIIFRNMSGTCGNTAGGNNSSNNFLGCLIQIDAAEVQDDFGSLKPLIIKNVKIENFIINESYPSNYTSGYNGYWWSALGCSIFYILQPNSSNGGTTIIENTDINVTFNMTNYAKTELITERCDSVNAIEHYKLYSCGVFRFGYPSYPILFKNVFVKCSGIVKHAFAAASSSNTLNMYVTHGYPLNILAPNGGNPNRSSSTNDIHKFSINAQYVDCTFDFNDFIIQIPIDLASGDILTSNNYGFTDRCEVFNNTALFPYSKNSSDSIHITGHLKILLPTKEEIDANPLSFGVLYLFRSSTNTNVLWDARISIIDDIETPNLKIRSSSGTKLFMNKDKIDQIVLDNNLMVDDDPSESGSGIFMCTTEQLKDEDFLNKNGFFYLRTT